MKKIKNIFFLLPALFLSACRHFAGNSQNADNRSSYLHDDRNTGVSSDSLPFPLFNTWTRVFRNLLQPSKGSKAGSIVLTLVTLFVFLSVTPGIKACRYTIREIGYTRLNIETYLVGLKADTVKYPAIVKDFGNLAYAYSINANLNYRISHSPGSRPELTCVNSNNDVIIRKKNVSLTDIHSFFKELLFSPLQKTMYSQIGNTFAFIVGFYDKKDKEVDAVIDKTLEQFEKISPNLDKKVDEQVLKIVFPASKRKQEELVLRAMGITGNEPVVVVFYGRGRLTGEPMTGDKITYGNLLNQLVTLGTDCECGIDLSPLLQRAIPFNWTDRMSQDVADMLGFDVENPMTLTEMGRILSKEPLETGKSEFSFTPRTIDLDNELARQKKRHEEEIIVKEEKSSALTITITILSVLAVLIVVTGLYMFLKKRN